MDIEGTGGICWVGHFFVLGWEGLRVPRLRVCYSSALNDDQKYKLKRPEEIIPTPYYCYPLEL